MFNIGVYIYPRSPMSVFFFFFFFFFFFLGGGV